MRVRTALAFVLVLLAMLALRQTSVAQAQFTSAIRARVTDDLSREGVSTVRVTLTGPTLKDPVVVTSDGEGNVSFPGLAPGRYALDIDKAGYFPQAFPDVVVDGAATGNAEVRLGDLNITAQRTISGTLKWDDDEPVTNAFIHVMTFRGGAYSRAPFVARVSTNDRGEFKVQGLRARRYIVFAYQPQQVVTPGAAVRVALPVFYPGTDRPETAQILDMRTMKDVSGLALTMKEEKGVAIEGTVTAENLPAGSRVQLGLVIPGVPAQQPLVVTATQVGSTFRLYPVPPGSYLLFAQGTPTIALPPGVDPTTITAAQAAALRTPGAEPSVTAIPVTVNRGTSITDLKVSIPAATPVVGKVEVEERQDGVSKIVPGTNTVVYLEWLPKMELQQGILANQTNEKGEFNLSGAVKGQAYLLGPGSNWGNAYLASFKQGQRDLAAGGLPVIAGGDPVQVLLKKDGGRISGKVTDGTKAPWRAFVVAAPRDRRIELWFVRTFTLSDGSFSLNNLAPGEYDVFAFDRNDEDIFYNPEFLRRYAAGGTAVTVGPSSSQSVELRLTNTEK